jgi:hypothetical protein
MRGGRGKVNSETVRQREGWRAEKTSLPHCLIVILLRPLRNRCVLCVKLWADGTVDLPSRLKHF